MITRPRFLVALLCLIASALSAAAQDTPAARLRRDVTFLASDECEGRGPGTKGIDLAADYIAKEFAKAGLKPGLGEKGYFQPFSISGAARLESPGRLTLKGPAGQEIVLKPGVDFQVLGLSGAGKVDAPLVFAGYGVTSKDAMYDDYAGLDVKGKVVVVLRRVPRWDSKEMPFAGKNRDVLAGLVNKFANAEAHGAAAIILVNDRSETASKTPDKLMGFGDTSFDGARSAPVVQMRRDQLDSIFRSVLSRSLIDVEKAIDAELKPQSAPLPGWSANLEANVVRTKVVVKNVVGVLEGAGPLANQTIVIGSHYDHLGYGGAGSLAKGSKAIHHGADDNASGSASVMELARHFGAIKDRQGRRLVFITFSGEERGLLGSKHYCDKEPVFPLDSTSTMFNLDMVGRLRPKDGKDELLIEGGGTSKGFSKLIEESNNPTGLSLKHSKALMPNSDHYPFFNKKIPVIFFWTGMHPQYHRPTDTADLINYDGMATIAKIAAKCIDKLSTQEERPEFVSIPVVGAGGRGGAPKLGIMPDYDAGKKGVLVGGLIDGGAAQKAGLKTGDLIVEIAGQPVLNLDTYLVVMRAQKAGHAIDVTVERGKEKVTLKITPQ
ncbi:MAG: M28 family peptidase [Gemmataceae bacterium]